jgi:hypothetical protein
MVLCYNYSINMKTKINKIIHLAAIFIAFLIHSNFVFAMDQGVLQVTGVTPTQTLATADNRFESGWQWIFNVTVPRNETVLKMKFADWVNGSSTIPTNANVRIYSSQSTNSYSTSTATVLTGSSVYSSNILLNSGLDLSTATVGRQIQIVVEVRVPTDTAAGSFASSYGIMTDLDPNQVIGSVDVVLDSNYVSSAFKQEQTQVIVGKVSMTARNEDVKVNSINFDPRFETLVPSAFSGFKNIKIYLNDEKIGTTTNWVPFLGPEPFTVNFDNSFLLRATRSETSLLYVFKISNPVPIVGLSDISLCSTVVPLVPLLPAAPVAPVGPAGPTGTFIFVQSMHPHPIV